MRRKSLRQDPPSQNRRTFRESANTEIKSEAIKLLKKRTGDDAAGRPPAANSRNVMFEDLVKLLVTDYTINNQRVSAGSSSLYVIFSRRSVR